MKIQFEHATSKYSPNYSPLFKGLSLMSLVLAFTLAASAKTINSQFSNSAGSRGYTLFIPDKADSTFGLIVALHGCVMTPQDMEKGLGLDAMGSENKFAVLYPEQTSQDNSLSCWNWFLPENQTRDQGESSIIVDMSRQVVQTYKLNPAKVVITGISAGGAMAANILGCYPDVFSGGLIASGLEFGAAQTEVAGNLAVSMGSANSTSDLVNKAISCGPTRTSLMPVLIVQGSADTVVSPKNADQTESFFIALNAQYFKNSGGDAQKIATVSQNLAAKSANGLAAVESNTSFANNVVVKKIIVQGMAHAWSGGSTEGGPYMDPNGPSASELLVETFFK